MKRLIVLALAAALTATPAVAAKKSKLENIDFGSFTCEQFLTEAAGSSADDVGGMLLWLDGYLSGVSGDTVLDWKGLEKFTELLMGYCSRNRDAMMLEAAEKVGIE